MKYTHPMWAILSVVLLAACSSGPSEGDIRTAYEQQLVQLMGKGWADSVKLNAVKKLGCTADGSAYVCDIEVRAVVAAMGKDEMIEARKVRMIKGDKGWIMSKAT